MRLGVSESCLTKYVRIMAFAFNSMLPRCPLYCLDMM